MSALVDDHDASRREAAFLAGERHCGRISITFPFMGFANSAANGYVVVEAGPKELVASMHMMPGRQVINDFSGVEATLAKFFKVATFKTITGESDLYQQIEGAWKKWDPTTQNWI